MVLRNRGYRVIKSEFHRYDTPTGDLIRKWLVGEWKVSKETIELIMTADKQAQQEWFDELSSSGIDYLILDRYTTSQLVYATSTGIDLEWTTRLQQYLRKPDFEILIDITADESIRRVGKHNNGKNDRYESDLRLLTKVRDSYLKMIPNVVDGTQTIDDVHKDIIKLVEGEERVAV